MCLGQRSRTTWWTYKDWCWPALLCRRSALACVAASRTGTGCLHYWRPVTANRSVRSSLHLSCHQLLSFLHLALDLDELAVIRNILGATRQLAAATAADKQPSVIVHRCKYVNFCHIYFGTTALCDFSLAAPYKNTLTYLLTGFVALLV